MNFIRKNNPGMWLWCTYTVLALLTLFIWTKNDWFPVTGDEPHYLVMADGIISDCVFEQSVTYAREFKNRTIFPSGLADRDATPSPQNTHAAMGPNGLYNIHNIGLPLLLAIPFKIGGVTGAKVFMVLLSSLAILLAWATSGLFTDNIKYRTLSVLASTFAAPLIPASGQIYPGIIAGLIPLASILLMQKRALKSTQLNKNDILIAILVSALPWLQIKFFATALIIAAGLSLQLYLQERSILKSSPFLLLLGGSSVLLAIYNLHAFGQYSGPYQDGVLEFSKHALMVLAGLHLDRFQGIFIQNPIYFVGLLFIVPFLKRFWLVGFTMLLAYASLVVPNALHINWYGGSSFAGRFAWAGSLTILPIVIFGLIKILQDTKKKGITLISILVAINLVTYATYTFHKFDFYNMASSKEYAESIWLSSYVSFLPWIDNFLPALYDSSRAFVYTPNASFLIFSIGLLILGFFYNRNLLYGFYKRLNLFIIISFAFIFVSGVTSVLPEKAKVWSASNLSSEIGEVLDDSRTTFSTLSQSGFLTYGPYIKLKKGKYRFTLTLDAHRQGTGPVGWWDVYILSKNKILLKGDINSSNQRQSIEGTFKIDSNTARNVVEIRTFYLGKGELTVHSLVLDVIN